MMKSMRLSSISTARSTVATLPGEVRSTIGGIDGSRAGGGGGGAL